MAAQLRQDVKDRILSDSQLYAKVSDKLGIKPAGLPLTFYRNATKLTTIDFLNFLSAETGISLEQLTSDPETEANLPAHQSEAR